MGQVTSIEQLAIKQGVQIEALEWFFEYVNEHSNPTIEKAVEKLDDLGRELDDLVLIELFEKQNAPYKWSHD